MLSDHMFLGPEVPELLRYVRGIYPEHFCLAQDLNLFANSWLFRTQMVEENVQHILVGSLLPRLLTAFQGAVIMSERGMSSEVRLLVRKVLEVCFRLVAVARSEENAYAYIQSDEPHRRKYLNKLKALKSVKLDKSEIQLIEKLRQDVDAAIQSQSIKEIGTQWFAERADLMDLYNTAYALFSESAHTNVRDLQPLLVQRENGEIEALEYGPDTFHMDDLLLTAIEATIIALESAFSVLPFGDVEGLANLRSRHDALFAAS